MGILHMPHGTCKARKRSHWRNASQYLRTPAQHVRVGLKSDVCRHSLSCQRTQYLPQAVISILSGGFIYFPSYINPSSPSALAITLRSNYFIPFTKVPSKTRCCSVIWRYYANCSRCSSYIFIEPCTVCLCSYLRLQFDVGVFVSRLCRIASLLAAVVPFLQSHVCNCKFVLLLTTSRAGRS